MAVRGDEVLLVEKNPSKHYAVLTVNREERGNSINFDLGRRFDEAWRDIKKDDDIWAVVVTAQGDKFFCAGEDLKDRAELDATYEGGFVKYVDDHGGFGNFDPRSHEIWKPIIGAVNGFAVAGGWYLAQMCDVRIAAEHAMFGVPEVRWNLPAPFMAQAQRMIPAAFALEATLWGARQYSAQRMYEVGFVNKVVPGAELREEAIRWAEEVCQMGPVAVWTHKELMYRYLYQDDAWAQRFGMALFDKVQAMEDSIEGPKAFAEKRPPQWKLR